MVDTQKKWGTYSNRANRWQTTEYSEYCNSIWISYNQAFDQIAVITTMRWWWKARVCFKYIFSLFEEGVSDVFTNSRERRKKNDSLHTQIWEKQQKKRNNLTTTSHKTVMHSDYSVEVILFMFGAYRRPTISSAVKKSHTSKFQLHLGKFMKILFSFCFSFAAPNTKSGMPFFLAHSNWTRQLGIVISMYWCVRVWVTYCC